MINNKQKDSHKLSGSKSSKTAMKGKISKCKNSISSMLRTYLSSTREALYVLNCINEWSLVLFHMQDAETGYTAFPWFLNIHACDGQRDYARPVDWLHNDWAERKHVACATLSHCRMSVAVVLCSA